MVFHVFSFGLARHGGGGGSVSQAELRQTNRSEEVLRKIAERGNGDFSSTRGATLTRENCVPFPITGFHREMRFHFDRARSPWAIDRTDAPGRRRELRNRQRTHALIFQRHTRLHVSIFSFP